MVLSKKKKKKKCGCRHVRCRAKRCEQPPRELDSGAASSLALYHTRNYGKQRKASHAKPRTLTRLTIKAGDRFQSSLRVRKYVNGTRKWWSDESTHDGLQLGIKNTTALTNSKRRSDSESPPQVGSRESVFERQRSKVFTQPGILEANSGARGSPCRRR